MHTSTPSARFWNAHCLKLPRQAREEDAMLMIRPVRQSDLDSLMDLAALTGFGLTTLPRDRELLAERIDDSEQSFRRMAQRPRGECYLFVMEDTTNHRV